MGHEERTSTSFSPERRKGQFLGTASLLVFVAAVTSVIITVCKPRKPALSVSELVIAAAWHARNSYVLYILESSNFCLR